MIEGIYVHQKMFLEELPLTWVSLLASAIICRKRTVTSPEQQELYILILFDIEFLFWNIKAIQIEVGGHTFKHLSLKSKFSRIHIELDRYRVFWCDVKRRSANGEQSCGNGSLPLVFFSCQKNLLNFLLFFCVKKFLFSLVFFQFCSFL